MFSSFRPALCAAPLLALGLGAMVQAAPAPLLKDGEPDWIRKPTAEDMEALWPADLKTSGEAKIRCRINLRGLTEGCVVLSEKPAGKGVGAAALLLTPNFVLRPRIVNGEPQLSVFSTTIRFRGEEGVPGGGRKIYSLVHPIWLKGPTLAEVAAVTPRVDGVGHAAMRCKVTTATGMLRACRVLTEIPAGRGVGAAAVKLAPRFQVLTTDDTKKQVGDTQVTVPVVFDPAAPEPRYLTGLDWRSRPSPSQAGSIFPAKANKDGVVTGRAVVDCALQADGTLAGCRVESEDPAGEGFGEAVLKLMSVMQAAAWTQDGRPIDGARVRMPFRLNLHDGEPAAK